MISLPSKIEQWMRDVAWKMFQLGIIPSDSPFSANKVAEIIASFVPQTNQGGIMGNIATREQRINLYFDATKGAYQITNFPDSAPDGETPLLRRTGFITDIEMFTDLGWRFATQIGATELGTLILQRGLDWEHSVANANGFLILDQPDKVSDPIMQAAIDALDDATEALVKQLNDYSAANPKYSRGLLHEVEERSEGE